MSSIGGKLFFCILSVGILNSQEQHEGQSKTAESQNTLERPIIQGCKDPAILEKWFAEKSQETKLDGISVIYKGQVVLEGPKSQTPAKVWSVSKGVSTLLAGFYLDEAMLDKKISDADPSLGKLYPNVTYRHLMSMTSGYDSVGGKVVTHPNAPADIRDNSQFPLQQELPLFEAGTQFAYWTDSYRLMGHLVELKAKEQSSKPKNLHQLFRDKVSASTGIEMESWHRLNDANGGRNLCDAGGGVVLSASHLSKLGHEMLNAYQEKPSSVFRPSWVKELTKLQVPHDTKLYEYNASAYDGRGVYGLGWWLNTPHPQTGNKPWSGLSPQSFAAKGVHQNLLLVDPVEEFVFSRVNIDVPLDTVKEPSDEWINDLSTSLLQALKACKVESKTEAAKENPPPAPKKNSFLDKIRSYFE